MAMRARRLLAAAALGWIAAGPAVAASDGKPALAATRRDVAAFAQLPQLEGPRLSPNGKFVAAKLPVNGKQYFAVLPLDGGKPSFVNPGDNDLNWWSWVNDDWLVIGIGSLQPVVNGEEWYITRAAAVSADGTKLNRLLPREAAQNADDVIWTAADGSPRVLIAYQTSIFSDEAGFWPKVEEVDVSTGKRRFAAKPQEGVFSWYADGAGRVRMGIGHDNSGRSTRVLYRDGDSGNFRIIDRAKTRDEGVMAPAMFLEDSSKALMLDDDDDGYSALYELDLKTLKRGKQLFASKGFDIAGLRTDATGFKLAGISVLEDRPGVRWTDPDMEAMDREIAAKVKGAQTRITSLSRDRNRAIVHVGGADAPGAYFVFDRATGSMELLGYTNERFKLSRLHPVRTVRYKARDGLEIAAVLTSPKGAGKNLPLIVLPHGGPFARDAEEWDWWSQFLADRGYLVIQPNYRGSSGYGTNFTKKGEGQWGLAMQDDLNDAVSFLAKEGLADPKRVCMVGASYGGYAAMRAAERDGAAYRCAISYAGVSDLNAMRNHDSQFLNSGARSDWLRKQAPDLRAVSPINDPAGFSTPILLVHGKKDKVVPVKQSRLLAERLRKAGKDVTYIEQPEADHHFSRSEDRLEFLNAMEAFLAKHNPA
jgi:dipeptidyl aminopeptidase/acylaminoacyl peptidase